MYCAKQRASEPVSIGSSATSQLGASTVSFASSIPGAIPSGLMSGEPTIFSCESSSSTVFFPAIPIAIVAIPKMIRTTPAA